MIADWVVLCLILVNAVVVVLGLVFLALFANDMKHRRITRGRRDDH